MKEIIKENVINYESKYRYYVDREGNLCRKKYHYYTDPYTFITIFIAIIGFLYFSEVKTCHLTLNNLPYTCAMYDQVLKEKNNNSMWNGNQNLTEIMSEAIKRLQNGTKINYTDG